MFKSLGKQIKRGLKVVRKTPICVLVLFVFIAMFIHYNMSKEGMTNQPSTPEKNQFIFFKMKECGHCKKMQPEWDILNNEKHVAGVEYVVYEASANQDKMNEYGVESFPTLKFHSKDGKIIDYDGERKSSAMKEFVEKNNA